jgi:hypothetical protein
MKLKLLLRAHPKPCVDSDEPRMKEQVPRLAHTLQRPLPNCVASQA